MNVASRIKKLSSVLKWPLVVLSIWGGCWLYERFEAFEFRPAVPTAMPTSAPTPLGQLTAPLLAPPPAVMLEQPAPRPTPSAEVGVKGIVSPTLRRPEEVAIDEGERVIGVQMDGVARAYVVKSFGLTSLRKIDDLGVHVVCDLVGGHAICVTHCDRSHSTRVFSGAEAGKQALAPLDVRVGGWDDGMVLVVEGERYWQHSPHIPLSDVEFVTTTWGEWLSEHPDSLVYLRG